MNQILNIENGVAYDESINRYEYHSHVSHLQSYNNSDEIRISIQHQDLIVLPSESYFIIEGSLKKPDGTNNDEAQLVNNCMAYLFDEIRYELNGVEIDRCRNVGYTSTLKNYASARTSEINMLKNAAFTPTKLTKPDGGFFSFCVPLKMLLGFAEDYKGVVINSKHEIILTRARNDNNTYSGAETYDAKIQLFKIEWNVPHITVSDVQRLNILGILNSTRDITMSYRCWDLYEYPMLQESQKHNWNVKTCNQLEKPRFIIFALQTERKNDKKKNASYFDHCNLSNVKLHLNSETYPYGDMHIKFKKHQYSLLYEMYRRFQGVYYQEKCEPILDPSEFRNCAPIVILDCSRQNESVKSGPVDVRLEFETEDKVSANTSAYCLILHDRVVSYNPLTSEVRKLI